MRPATQVRFIPAGYGPPRRPDARIWVDGCYHGEVRSGGFAWVFEAGGRILAEDAAPLPRIWSANEAELTAAVEALRSAPTNRHPRFEVVTDSKFVSERQGRWQKRGSALHRLDEELAQLLAERRSSIRWVKRGSPYNARADKLAKEAWRNRAKPWEPSK